MKRRQKITILQVTAQKNDDEDSKSTKKRTSMQMRVMKSTKKTWKVTILEKSGTRKFWY